MKNSKRVQLVITFHHLFKEFCNIKHKNLYLSYMDQEAQQLLMHGLMVTFRSARKLTSYLLRAKLYPLENTVGFLSVMVNDVMVMTTLRKDRLSLAS